MINQLEKERMFGSSSSNSILQLHGCLLACSFSLLFCSLFSVSRGKGNGESFVRFLLPPFFTREGFIHSLIHSFIDFQCQSSSSLVLLSVSHCFVCLAQPTYLFRIYVCFSDSFVVIVLFLNQEFVQDFNDLKRFC